VNILHAIYTFLLTFFFKRYSFDNGRKEQRKKKINKRQEKKCVNNVGHLLNISVLFKYTRSQYIYIYMYKIRIECARQNKSYYMLYNEIEKEKKKKSSRCYIFNEHTM
jgi:hypothetical protein